MTAPEEKIAEATREMARLLNEYKTVSLATNSSAGLPTVSYAPAALDSARNLYLFVSELSEHTANLHARPEVSIMLIEDESRSKQLFARNRLTMTGIAQHIAREDEQWSEAAEVYRARFGKFFDQLSTLKDFHMFKIQPTSARLVVGFGAAYDIALPDWTALALARG